MGGKRRGNRGIGSRAVDDTSRQLRALLPSYVDLGERIIPIVPRHLSVVDWRQVHNYPLTVYGQRYDYLCDACANIIECGGRRVAGTWRTCCLKISYLDFMDPGFGKGA